MPDYVAPTPQAEEGTITVYENVAALHSVLPEEGAVTIYENVAALHSLQPEEGAVSIYENAECQPLGKLQQDESPCGIYSLLKPPDAPVTENQVSVVDRQTDR